MSQSPPEWSFHKVCGGGNDFILMDAREGEPDMSPRQLARQLCRRGLSLGADGLLWITSSRSADLGLTYFNADGSQAFCGNGALCAARWGHVHAGLPADLTLETDNGILPMQVHGRQVRMEVPPPGAIQDGISLEVAALAERGLSLNTGCPHLVVLVETMPDGAQFADAASRLRHHPQLGPAGTNVDFVEVLDAHRLRVRTWERGVEGETLASGTGCLASALAAARRGRVQSPVTCLVEGGAPLSVRFTVRGDGFEAVSLQGEARLIASGKAGADAFSPQG